MVRVDEETEIPDSGAVFTFGKSKFADNVPSKFWIRNDIVAKLDCGDEHTILTTENGRVYVFGTNDWGQLGLGNSKNISKPSCLKALKQEKAICVAGGRSHSLVYTESRKVYAFGANGEGQLGLGDTANRLEPCHVAGIQEEVKMMAAGSYHSAVVTTDGKLYTFGSNAEGQLGLGEVKSVSTPVMVQMDLPITTASCGYYHTAFVADGKLYTFGEKEGGKLGLLEKQLQRGTNVPQCIFSVTERVAHVSCGGNHTAVLTECGKLYTFGSGLNGQLGLGTMVMETGAPSLVGALDHQKVVAISCGESHTAIVTEQGKLLTCGDGRHGKLGLGNENFSNQFIPVPVRRFHEFVVHQVACGGCHMVVLATKRSSDDPTLELMDDDDVEIHSSVADGADSMLTARGRRREKELQGSRPLLSVGKLLPPLLSSDSKKNSSPIDTLDDDDDLDRLQQELTGVDTEDQGDRNRELKLTLEVGQVDKPKSATMESKSDVHSNTGKHKVKHTIGHEEEEEEDRKSRDQDFQSDNENGSNSNSETEEEGKGPSTKENVAASTDDGQKGADDGSDTNGNRREAQPKKESFLKQIFSFGRKRKISKGKEGDDVMSGKTKEDKDVTTVSRVTTEDLTVVTKTEQDDGVQKEKDSTEESSRVAAESPRDEEQTASSKKNKSGSQMSNICTIL